jgi:hypothetical protein
VPGAGDEAAVAELFEVPFDEEFDDLAVGVIARGNGRLALYRLSPSINIFEKC